MTGSDFIIKNLPPEMAGRAAELEKAVIRSCWSERAIRDFIAGGGVYLVALCEDELIGFLGMYFTVDFTELTNFGVAEAFRRRGVGDALFDAAKRLTAKAGLSRLLLDVREGNATARRFYENRGCKLVGKRRNFYENPTENAMLYDCITCS